jgi:hypothetical protein
VVLIKCRDQEEDEAELRFSYRCWDIQVSNYLRKLPAIVNKDAKLKPIFP